MHALQEQVIATDVKEGCGCFLCLFSPGPGCCESGQEVSARSLLVSSLFRGLAAPDKAAVHGLSLANDGFRALQGAIPGAQMLSGST